MSDASRSRGQELSGLQRARTTPAADGDGGALSAPDELAPFRQVFENSPLGMALAETDGRLVRVNQALCVMLEYSPQQLCSLTIFDVTHLDDRDAVRQSVRGILSGEEPIYRAQMRLVTRTGRTVWARLTASAFRGNGGVLGLGIIEDISSVRRAEQARDHTQQRYQMIFDRAADIICTLDADLRITSVSPAVRRVLGYEPHELVGKVLGTMGIVAEHLMDKARQDLQRVLAGEQTMSPYILHSRDGRTVHVEIRGSLLQPDGEPAEAMLVVRDTTQQVQALEALRESEGNYRRLVEQALDGIIILQDGIVRFVNPRIAWLLDYPRQQLVGRPYTEFLTPEHLPQAEHYLADRMSDQDSSYLIMTKLRHRDGRWIDMEVSVGPTSYDGRPAALVVLRDATERKTTQDALRRSENLLSSIIEQSPVSTWISDSGGTLIRLNDACRRLFGVTSDDQVVGRYNLFQDNLLQAAGLNETLRRVYERGLIVHFRIDYDFAQVRHVSVPGAAHRLLDVTIFPIKDARGRVANAVIQHEDVTELQQREEQLRQAQKLEAVGKLAGGVAHDFRNQLTVVNGYCELLLKQMSPDDPSREAVQEIYDAAQRSTDLTSQLLAYSRKQLLQPAPTNLNSLIGGMKSMLLQALGRNIELSLNLAEDLHQIEADPNQVQQMVMNVVLNARDAMPDGGQLFIQTCNEDLDEGYVRRHRGSVPGPHVQLTITDSGVGMDDDTRRRMFDPFFTTKPVGQGTGLGLSMVYGFVRQSGGHICVRSRPGQGARLRIHFPTLELRRSLHQTPWESGDVLTED